MQSTVNVIGNRDCELPSHRRVSGLHVYTYSSIVTALQTRPRLQPIVYPAPNPPSLEILRARMLDCGCSPSASLKKTAEAFFSSLCGSGAKRVVDVRLNNVSQLVGFSKRDDLSCRLRAICGIEYVHRPVLSPTENSERVPEAQARLGWIQAEIDRDRRDRNHSGGCRAPSRAPMPPQ